MSNANSVASFEVAPLDDAYDYSYDERIEMDDGQINDVQGTSFEIGYEPNPAGATRDAVDHSGSVLFEASGSGQPDYAKPRPAVYDSRKFKYDRTAGLTKSAVSFATSKADRLDPEEAGRLLARIHRITGIYKKPDEYRVAFDRALFFEHTINGASRMQSGEGYLRVLNTSYPIAQVTRALTGKLRRFFRAFADEIADTNKFVIKSYDPDDPDTVDRYGQLMQVAYERGLQKYPYLAHDSADAMLHVTPEERFALIASKKHIIETLKTAPN